MLKICPKCRRAYIGNDTVCNYCIPRIPKFPISNKKIVYDDVDWLDASFEDLKICTESNFGFEKVFECEKSNSPGYYDVNEDLRFNPKEGNCIDECFKLFLDDYLSPRIIIKQCEAVFKGRESSVLIRRPYVGVVFANDAEERFIPFEAFRKRSLNAINISTKERKRVLCPAPYASDSTYELVYMLLKRDKYKKFRLTVGDRIIRNGYLYRPWSGLPFLVENVSSFSINE